MKPSHQINQLASQPALARVVQFPAARTLLPKPIEPRIERLATLYRLVSQLPLKDLDSLTDIAARLIQANKAAER